MSVSDRVNGVRWVDLPSFPDSNGELIVGDVTAHVAFHLERIFFVIGAPAGSFRGDHAHRRCTQILVCLRGVVEVLADDGDERDRYVLDNPRVALAVPPLTWTHQAFGEDSLLLVLADEPYDEAEYIRSRHDFNRIVNDMGLKEGSAPS